MSIILNPSYSSQKISAFSRLTENEKEYYSKLFLSHAENDQVSKEKFPLLLGLLGTDISANFATRIFNLFSSDGTHIKLEEYLNYLDLYHHGSERERCLTTFKLMDLNRNAQINFSEFRSYMELIRTAVKKVNAQSEEEILSEEEIKILFNKISNGRKFFRFKDFEKVYMEKPKLLSWTHYFKNNEDIFMDRITKNIKLILKMLDKLYYNITDLLENNLQVSTSNCEFSFESFSKFVEKFNEEVVKFKNSFEKLQREIPVTETVTETIIEDENKTYDNLVNLIRAKYTSDYALLNDNNKNVMENKSNLDKDIFIDFDYENLNTEPRLGENKIKSIKNSSQFLRNTIEEFDIRILEEEKNQYVNKQIEKESISFMNYQNFGAQFINFFSAFNILITIHRKTLKWINIFITKRTKNYENKKPIRSSTSSSLLNKVNKPVEEKVISHTSPFAFKSKENSIKFTDENFAILLNMIMGIHIVVESTSDLQISEKTDLKQFLVTSKYSLPSANFKSAHLEGIFYISTFGAVIFHNIRKLFSIDKSTYIQSLSPGDFVTEMLISSSSLIEELFSTSKSGSLFYHTRDGKYILKTISKKEYICLRHILTDYYLHLKNNDFSLLPKFYGCYKLVRKLNGTKFRYHFLVMDNVFSTNKSIELKYDLKGSKLGREVLCNLCKICKFCNLPENEKNISYALKDLDLDRSGKKINLGMKKNWILETLERDCTFLMRQGIIDYSLLIGIHYEDNISPCQAKAQVLSKNDKTGIQPSNDNIKVSSSDRGIISTDGSETYYLGLIDILVKFNCMKKCEYLCKLFYHCNNKMSIVPPKMYKKRLISYIDTATD